MFFAKSRYADAIFHDCPNTATRVIASALALSAPFGQRDAGQLPPPLQ
jgi:hypothetical protein